MSAASDARDQHAQLFLTALADLDDAYAGAQLDRRGMLLERFKRDEWPNVLEAHAWASRLETPQGLRCCAIFPSAGAYVLGHLLTLPERLDWLELASAAVVRLKASLTPLMDPDKLFSVELNTLGNLAIAYFEAGRYRAASRTRIKALRLIEEIEEPVRRAKRRAAVLGSLAADFNETRKYRAAVHCAERALAELASASVEPGMERVTAQINLGLSHKHLFQLGHGREHLDRAEEVYRDALTIAVAGGMIQSETDLLGNLGELSYERGEFVDAENLHRQQLDRAQSGARKWSEGSALRAIAIDVEAQGRLTEAEAIYTEAREAFLLAGEESSAEDAAQRLAALRGRQQNDDRESPPEVP